MTLEYFLQCLLEDGKDNPLCAILKDRRLEFDKPLSPESIVWLAGALQMLFKTYKEGISAIQEIEFWAQFYDFASRLLQIPVLQTS